jgi:hypothetical protein
VRMLTDAEHTYWTGYVRGIADQMRLRDWDIVLARDVCEGAGARITVTYGRRTAVIEFGYSFWTNGVVEQRQTIVHELIHIYLDDIDTVMRDAKDIIASDVFELTRQTVANRIELATDGLAEGIAPLFPLPDPSEAS